MNNRPYIAPVEDWDEKDKRPYLRLPIPDYNNEREDEEKTESKCVIVIDMIDPE